VEIRYDSRLNGAPLRGGCVRPKPPPIPERSSVHNFRILAGHNCPVTSLTRLYLVEDGVASYWSYRRASDVFHTAATVWATVRATGLIKRLWAVIERHAGETNGTLLNLHNRPIERSFAFRRQS
jgi:hypothetical protein